VIGDEVVAVVVGVPGLKENKWISAKIDNKKRTSYEGAYYYILNTCI